MSKEVSNVSTSDKVAQALMMGNLAPLNEQERLSHYRAVCETLGLNPLTTPFGYIPLNGKLVLYANKGCAEQLRQIHKISIKIVARELIDDIYVVTVEASYPDGRTDSSTGAVAVKGKVGEERANAYLKCETKAKRRVTLSICGLNMLDETEVETIPGVIPPASPPIPPKDTAPSAPKVRSRAVINSEIFEAAEKLKCSKEDTLEWAEQVTGKAPKQMTIADMEKFLGVLHYELGRNGVES